MSKMFKRRDVPVYMSSEAAECGLTCLAMIAKSHGSEIDPASLRERFPVSLSGLSLRALLRVADAISLNSRALKVELDAISKLSLPAIVHWNFCHYVVLVKIGKKRLIVHDPSLGKVSYTLEEFSRHYTGVAVEFQPSSSSYDGVEKRKIQIRSLWATSQGFVKEGFHFVILSIFSQLLVFIAPIQMQVIADKVVGANDYGLVPLVVATFGIVGILGATNDALRNWTIQTISVSATHQITSNVVKHALRLPASFFEKRHVGDIVSRIGSIRAIQDIISSGVVSAALDGLFSIAALAILFSYNFPVAVVVVIFTAISAAISLLFYNPIKRAAEARIVSAATEQTLMLETLRAATTIKLMGAEVEREMVWRNAHIKTVNTSLSQAKIEIIGDFIRRILTVIQFALVVMIAISSLSSGIISFGAFLVVLSYRQTISDRILSFISQIIKIKMIRLYLDRLSDIVLESQEGGASHLKAMDVLPAIELRGVSFRYGVGDMLALENVNLKIYPGEFVAITGRSGSGKTTLLKLITGLVKPTEGLVLINGKAAQDEDWQLLRMAAGVVMQDDKLIAGSLAENISFFDPAGTSEDVVAAARLAGIHSEIEAKPMRYESLVGDMGSVLSAGQKQRILLARAFYRRPKILILDEGTANIDVDSEAEIANRVSEYPATRIAVTHRPALAERASRVIEVSGRTVTVKGASSDPVMAEYKLEESAS